MRYLTRSAAVVAVIKREGDKILLLLQKRKNTGFADGLWDLSCSGHVEEGESIRQAAVRECKEELGITVKEEDASFFALIHKRDEPCDLTYYNAYFRVEKYSGEPKITESDKCAELKWFCLDELPCDLLDDRRAALKSLFGGAGYYSYGWAK